MSISELNDAVHLVRLLPGICYMLVFQLILLKELDDYKIGLGVSTILIIISTHVISLLVNIYYDNKNKVDSHPNRIKISNYSSEIEAKILPTICLCLFFNIVMGSHIVMYLTVFEALSWVFVGVFYSCIYSLKPFEVSKSMFGEFYNAFGFGFLVMEFIFYVHLHNLISPVFLVPVFCFYSGAVFMASSLDVISDKVYRRTISVVIGTKNSKYIAIVFLFLVNFSFAFLGDYSRLLFWGFNLLSWFVIFRLLKIEYKIENKIKIMKHINIIGFISCFLYLSSVI